MSEPTRGQNLARPGEPDEHANGVRELLEPDAAPRSDQTRLVTLRHLLQSVFRAKLLLLAFVLLGAFGGVVFALWQPNVYRSQARVLVSGIGQDSLIPELRLLNPDAARQAAPANPRSSMQAMLNDDGLQYRVIEHVGAATILRPVPEPRQPAGETGILKSVEYQVRRVLHSLHQRVDQAGVDTFSALQVLKQNLLVEVSDRTDFITVSYAANDPYLAQTILRAVLAEAQARHAAFWSSPRLLEALDRDRSQARAAHLAASREYDEFVREQRIEDFDQQRNDIQSEISTWRLEEMRVAREIDEDEDLVRRLEPMVNAPRETVSTPPPRAELDQTIVALESERSRLTRELRTSLLRDGDAVLERIKSQIDEVDRQIQARRSEIRPPASVVAPDTERQRLLDRWEEARMRLARNKSYASAIAADLKHARERHGELTSHGPRYRELLQRVEATRNTLEAAEDMLKQTQRRSELTAQGLSALKLLAEPTLPLEKSEPKRERIVLGSVLGALFIGLLLLFARAVTDPTVRGPEDLQRIPGVRVLATLPDSKRVHVRRHRRLRALRWS
jgi:uncharacterized protein involved in exopolysaccharide biosynthesis